MQTMTVFGLGLAGLLSLGLSFMGFMILGIGEACCPSNTTGGWAYFLFAAFLTSSAGVIILYAVWAPPKPLIVWSWAIAIVTALEVMTFQTYDPAKSTSHNLFFIFLQGWTIPQVWLPFGIAAFCQFEARKGSRSRKSSLGTLGA
jgi:hypothetical protein